MDHGQRVGRFGAAWVALLVAASSALTATATRPAAARAGAGSGALPAAASPSWQQAPVVGSAPSPRYGSSLAFDGSSDQLVLFGGVGLQSAQNDCGLGFDDLANQGSGVLQSIENGSADLSSLIALADQFGGVAGAAAIADFYDGLCFQHGSQWPIARGDMWTWDGNQWSPVTGIPLPPARTGGALAYDEATHQLLLFGGADSDANALGDTWSWDGRRWQQLHPAHSPSARSGAAMAYDPLLGAVMLYGGWDGLTTNGAAGVEGDTWSWNGSDWTPITIAPDAVHDPPPTSLASMAFDAATGQLVLTSGTANLGGMGVYGLQAADEPQVGASWTWNGTRWVLLSDLQSFDEGDPDASLLITTHGSAMAFDAATGELLGHTDDVLSATSGSGNASDLAWNG